MLRISIFLVLASLYTLRILFQDSLYFLRFKSQSFPFKVGKEFFFNSFYFRMNACIVFSCTITFIAYSELTRINEKTDSNLYTHTHASKISLCLLSVLLLIILYLFVLFNIITIAAFDPSTHKPSYKHQTLLLFDFLLSIFFEFRSLTLINSILMLGTAFSRRRIIHILIYMQ